jgi:ABC-type molybdate transport system substrate-binding protein
VEGVPIPPAHNVVATYPIARLSDSPAEAEEFVDFVLTDRGRALLEEHGFRTQ